MSRGPKSYGSYADFVREEVKPLNRVGFCVDDLESEATCQYGIEEIDLRPSVELDFER